MEVQLEAEAIFQLHAVVSAVREFIEDDPEMFGLSLDEGFARARSLNRILEKLLVGLVPVRGRAADYEVVELGERECLVHRRLLDQVAGTDRLAIHPLSVVGVAEQSLFWKDIRRVLFTGARFRVLCRMAQDGLQASWTPVKLTNVLRSVEPGLADQIDALGSGALAAMAGASKPDGRRQRKQQLMHEALVNYATSFADHYDRSITTQELAEVGLPAEQHCMSFGNLEEKRKAFDPITEYLVNRFDLPQEPDVAAQYRGDALMNVGLLLPERVMPLVTSDDVSSSAPQERFLDSEFVAIYW